MNFAGLIYILVAHYLAGKGLLKLFGVQLKPVPFFCLCMIAGVPLLSFAPCFVQLLHLPVDTIPVFIAVTVITAAFSIPLWRNFKRPQLPKIVFPALYEWPYLIVCLWFTIFSVWRCFYYPPYSRDMLAGPELLAEFAVREKTMISSVFTVDLSTSNNYFKSPFITGLQIIYKLLVCPFGQLWLSVLFVCFIVWLYNMLRNRLHPILASLLLLIFFAMPELFAYTFLMLYDYSNMIFFFLGFYFLIRYLENKKLNEFAFSAFLFGLATYIRTETLILITLILPLLLFYFYRWKLPVKSMAYNFGIFLLVPIAFYIINIQVFIRFFIPIPFDLSQNINPDLGNISAIFRRLQDINTQLIFTYKGIALYGYFVFLFCAVFITDLIWLRRFNLESRIALYAIMVVYFGLGIIGYLLPLADLQNTTKRGLFKALPLMLLYMANSGVLLRFSAFIKDWEYAKPVQKVQKRK